MTPILPLDPLDPAVADGILKVMSLACAQEARLLQIEGAAPWARSGADLAASGRVYLGAVEAGEVVAVLSLGDDDEAGQRCIFDLVVHPQRQRQGLGRRLVEAALAGSPGQACTVCAAAANAPAQALYAALGFVAVRRGAMGTQGLPVLKLRRAAAVPSPSLQIRPAVPSDVAACVALRGRTRENAISVEQLAAFGITADSWADDVRKGTLLGHVAMQAGEIVGYGFGDRDSGEVVVMALLPEAEGRGVGKALLARVTADLRQAGHARLHLGCSPDPACRSHGFYRHLGWRSTGRFDAHGDEILELPPAPPTANGATA